MRFREALIQCAVAAGVAGMLSQMLVLRLNPEIELTASGALIGLLLGVSWGIACATLPLLPFAFLVARMRPTHERPQAWVVPELVFGVCFVAAVVNRLNASVHPFFLSSRGRRLIDQDGVAWLVVGILVLVCGMWLRDRQIRGFARIALTALAFVLPIVRVTFEPTPPQRVAAIEARPIGRPSRTLVVLGVEGLDSGVLLSAASDSRFPVIAGLMNRGTWGLLQPHRPYLRRSIWTTVATGSYPRRHGVKSRWAWSVPYLGEPLRLLPWMSWGSKGFVPWQLGARIEPPVARYPALWQRLDASEEPSRVLAWPGLWSPLAGIETRLGDPAETRMRTDFLASLAGILGRLEPEQREVLKQCVEWDIAALEEARRSVAEGEKNIWIHLRSLAMVRQDFEPMDARDVSERALLQLVLEIIDDGIGRILVDSPSGLLLAVTSPYGMVPPGPGERFRRLLGLGDQWRASAEDCPDGVLLLAGDGVTAGKRFSQVALADVAPTLCYLLGLPVAQYMEGRVILDAVEPSFVAEHPLRVTG